MSLLTKPSIIFMSPRNDTVSNIDGFNLQFKFSGYQLYKASYTFYQNVNGQWEKPRFLGGFVQSFNPPLYNGTNAIQAVPPLYFQDTSQGSFVNSNMGWSVEVLGKITTITVVGSEGTYTIQNHNFTTGDRVVVHKAGQAPDPINYVYVINNNQIKLYLTIDGAFNATSSYITGLTTGSTVTPTLTSEISPFIVIDQAVLKLNSVKITEPSFTFKPFWVAGRDVPIISHWNASLYDSKNNLIEQSQEIYNAQIEYKFISALLSKNSYIVKFEAVDNQNYQYTTGNVSFEVVYTTPDVGFVPVAKNDCVNSAIDVKWTNATSIDGIVTGGYSYIKDFYEIGNYGLKLNANSTLLYSVNIPQDSPPIFIFSPEDNNFNGTIAKLENEITKDFASVGFSQSKQLFEYNVNGVTTNIDAPPIEEHIETVVDTSITLLNSTRKRSYVEFSFKGNTYQEVLDTVIKPKFNIAGSIPYQGKKAYVGGQSQTLYACGDYKDYTDGTKVYRETYNKVFAKNQQGISLVYGDNTFSTFLFYYPDLPFIDGTTKIHNEVWCNMLPAVSVITRNAEAIWLDGAKGVFMNVLNRNITATGQPTVTDFVNKLNAFVDAGNPLSILLPINKENNYAYGIRIIREQSSPTVERIGLAIGKVANVGTNAMTTAPRNDFDSIFPWSNMKVCNVKNGGVWAFYGDPDFKNDGSNGDVMVQIPKHYYKKEVVPYGGENTITNEWISAEMHDGFQLNPKFRVDGVSTEFYNELKFFYFGAYEGIITKLNSSATTTSLCSAGFYKGINNFGLPSSNLLPQCRSEALVKGVIYGIQDIASYSMIKMLFDIEFATLNSQSIMRGMTSVPSTKYNVVFQKITGGQPSYFLYTGTEPPLVPNTELIFISTTTGIKTSLGVFDGMELYPSVGVERWKIYFTGWETTTLQNNDSGTIYNGKARVGNTVDVGRKTVKFSSGSLTSNSSGLESFTYRGIENLYGNVFKKTDGVNMKLGQAYVCCQPSKYTSASITADYQSVNYLSPRTSGFIKTMGFDSNFPWFESTLVNTGASSTTYRCDTYTYSGSANITSFNTGGYYLGGVQSGINCLYDREEVVNDVNFGTRLIMECEQG